MGIGDPLVIVLSLYIRIRQVLGVRTILTLECPAQPLYLSKVHLLSLLWQSLQVLLLSFYGNVVSSV